MYLVESKSNFYKQKVHETRKWPFQASAVHYCLWGKSSVSIAQSVIKHFHTHNWLLYEITLKVRVKAIHTKLFHIDFNFNCFFNFKGRKKKCSFQYQYNQDFYLNSTFLKWNEKVLVKKLNLPFQTSTFGVIVCMIREQFPLIAQTILYNILHFIYTMKAKKVDVI